MVLNHNSHISHILCAYCNRKELSTHIDNNTIDECCFDYMRKYGINFNVERNVIVTKFYDLMKQLARELGVLIIRKEKYTGEGRQKTETIARKIPGFPGKCTVFQPYCSPKRINTDKLDKLFNDAISFLLGGNGLSRIRQTQGDHHTDAIILISDDEGEENAIEILEVS